MLDAFTDSMSLAEEATTANGNAEANQEKYMESTAGKLCTNSRTPFTVPEL